METLANAAYLSSPDQQQGLGGAPSDLQIGIAGGAAAHLGALGGGSLGGALAPCISPTVMAAMAPAMNSIGGSRSLLPSAQQLHGPGRHLQILDHTVHRIDVHAKPNGEDDKEMVVSNLRHFTLKIGVIDPRCGIGRDAELPLKAELLYENGQLVEQLATCEPLLVGKTEVVAMQGTAMFKLRITSLSSHRDKQRFRIRVSPTDTGLLLREPGLSVVTTPMKCVTKLTHRSSTSKAEAADGENAGGENGEDAADGEGEGGKKRRRDELESALDAQGAQIEALQGAASSILLQLETLRELLQRAVGDAVAPPTPAKPAKPVPVVVRPAAVAAVAVAPTAQRRRSHPLTASSWGCARAGRPRRAASAREGGMCVAPLSGRGGRARGMRALTNKCYIVRAVCRSAHCTVPRCQWGVNVNTDPHTLRVGQPCGCLCVSLGQ
mmetsp:Transcript_3048/g.10032  ORF Transcript_3048/g.10032 Transcript_3048/m.10032 type:complete len:437 (+) Transcript_3048:42-1352(+)